MQLLAICREFCSVQNRQQLYTSYLIAKARGYALHDRRYFFQAFASDTNFKVPTAYTLSERFDVLSSTVELTLV